MRTIEDRFHEFQSVDLRVKLLDAKFQKLMLQMEGIVALLTPEDNQRGALSPSQQEAVVKMEREVLNMLKLLYRGCVL